MSSNAYTTRLGVRRALCVGALAAAVGLSPAAFGQAADDEVLEEIITTGTRLARQD